MFPFYFFSLLLAFPLVGISNTVTAFFNLPLSLFVASEKD
jgi:hypothetical protein